MYSFKEVSSRSSSIKEEHLNYQLNVVKSNKSSTNHSQVLSSSTTQSDNNDNPTIHNSTNSSIQESNQNYKNDSDEKNNATKKLPILQLLKKHYVVGLLCLMVAFGGFVFGWDTGTISGFIEMPNFKQTFAQYDIETNTFKFSNSRIGLIISIFNIGCAVGGITIPKLGDVFGRKIGIISSMVIYIIGIILQISSFHWIQFMVGRIISGLAVGSISVLSPMFIAETSPSEIRGVLVSCYQLMITLGIFLGYVTTFGTSVTFSDTRQWKIPLGLCFIWSLFLIGGIYCLPESPRYLIEKNMPEKARISIAKVNNLSFDDELVTKELDSLFMVINEQHEEGNATWSELLHGQPHIFLRLVIGIALQSFQQLTGNNYFFYYGTSIFKSIGLSNSYVTSIILGAVNFGSTFIALYTVDTMTRRSLLMFGSSAMSIILLVFATVGSTILFPNGYDNPTDREAGIGMVVLTCVFIFIFAITWAPGVFVVVSETYPLRIRSKGMAIATAANWIWGFLIAFFTPFIVSQIKFAYGYVFMACTLGALIFVYFTVPETSGLSLEEVDNLYEFYKPFQASMAVDDRMEDIRIKEARRVSAEIAEEKLRNKQPGYS